MSFRVESQTVQEVVKQVCSSTLKPCSDSSRVIKIALVIERDIKPFIKDNKSIPFNRSVETVFKQSRSLGIICPEFYLETPLLQGELFAHMSQFIQNSPFIWSAIIIPNDTNLDHLSKKNPTIIQPEQIIETILKNLPKEYHQDSCLLRIRDFHHVIQETEGIQTIHSNNTDTISQSESAELVDVREEYDQFI